MARFNDQHHISRFISENKFPSIHDDIAQVISEHTGAFTRCLDIGCCYGLLSARLVIDCGKEMVVGIDGSPAYLESAIMMPQIAYRCLRVSNSTLSVMAGIITAYRLNMVVARRVLPEIYDCIGPDGMQRMAQMFRNTGIGCIAIEGRVNAGISKHPLKIIDNEILTLSSHYATVHRVRNCAIMEAA